ncbi:unnamed protein product [Paramecium primaurelia]|uniref:RING-type domain-containing protein n=1 Tax=Paramecium primaurelia TaxID=5886 RepID=A0A8S1JT37_PARPR|nr:unnamed protein product [Paramecium primaurelia]
MGCLFTQTYKQNDFQKHNEKIVPKQFLENNNSPLTPKKLNQTQEVPNQVNLFNHFALMQENVSDLLTESSLDDQEILEIDEFLKQRTVQLKKIKARKYQQKFHSQRDLGKVSEKEKRIKRTSSQIQLANIDISINYLYHQKFLNVYKVQEQPQQIQKNCILLDLDQSEVDIEIGINSLDNSFSSMKQLVPLCQYCNQEIQQDQYQLECFHIYHTKCLELLIINQIEKDQTQIYCMCHQSIKTKLIKSILKINDADLKINNDQESNQHLIRLFKNQYKILESILK